MLMMMMMMMMMVMMMMMMMMMIKNKIQTAVINILNLHILIKTWRLVCTLHTFSKVIVQILNTCLYITKVGGLEPRLSKYLTVNYKN